MFPWHKVCLILERSQPGFTPQMEGTECCGAIAGGRSVHERVDAIDDVTRALFSVQKQFEARGASGTQPNRVTASVIALQNKVAMAAHATSLAERQRPGQPGHRRRRTHGDQHLRPRRPWQSAEAHDDQLQQVRHPHAKTEGKLHEVLRTYLRQRGSVHPMILICCDDGRCDGG